MRLVVSMIAVTIAFVSAPSFAANTGVVALSWTAPGDDGLAGRATIYDLRYSKYPITVAGFANQTRVLPMPAPSPAGTRENFTVTGLEPGVTYWFAIKAGDEVGNWSIRSNLVGRVALNTVDVPLGPTQVLHFGNPFPNPARSHASFAMTLPQATDIDVTVFDIQGRQVRVLAEGDWPAGETTVAWNLRDGSGSRVSPGTYMVRAQLGSTQMIRRVTVLG